MVSVFLLYQGFRIGGTNWVQFVFYYITQICNKSISKCFFNKFIFRNYTTKILLYICSISKRYDGGL